MKIGSRRLIAQFLALSAMFLLLSCRQIFPDCPESYSPNFHTSVNGLNSISVAQAFGSEPNIDIVAYTISNKVTSISFNLDFDSTKMTYAGYLTGAFLEQNGSHTSYAVNLDPKNL